MQIGYHFQHLLNSIFSPLVFEAARCLLVISSLETKKGASVVNMAVATAWAPLAVASLTQLWKRDTSPSAAASHVQLLDLIASSIRSLPVRISGKETERSFVRPFKDYLHFLVLSQQAEGLRFMLRFSQASPSSHEMLPARRSFVT